LIVKLKRCESGVNCTAKDHKIPATTLKDWLSGRVMDKTNLDQAGISMRTIKELSTFVKDCATIVYGNLINKL